MGDIRRYARGNTASWNADDWCRALTEHFFTERSDGLPVLFFVDDEVLGEIYGGDPGDAIESITDLVWNKLDHPELQRLLSLV